MRMIRAKVIPGVAALLAVSPVLAQGNHPPLAPFSSEPDTVVGTVLEVHANAPSGATIAVIHQKSQTDQTKFASLLAHADGGPVQMRGEQGPWVNASLPPLQSGLGGGLRMLPTADLKIAEYDALPVKCSAPRLPAERVPAARN